MSVWLCLPSKRPPEEAEPVFAKWRAMGYNIAMQVDGELFRGAPLVEWVMNIETQHARITRPYSGYAESINYLAKWIFQFPHCDWIVAAGDDTLPDPNKTADEIARECFQYFASDEMIGRAKMCGSSPTMEGTFGVMQPTGDTWSDPRGKIIERIAGSPWLGREWCLRANGGRGPLWPGFFHMWADEALQITAQQLGVFWQRPDLCHLHLHWGRPREGERFADHTRMPAFLARANSTEQTDKDRAEFNRLRHGGFKECYPK